MPLAQRSALPTIPGVPAWGAVAIAVAVTFVGFTVDAVRGSELTAAFSVFFFLGCLAAVLAVRNRGLFTAMVQPPLILVLAVPLAYQQFAANGGGLKDLLFNIALPLVNRFPLMLTTTLVVAAIGAGRMYIRHQAAGVVARRARRPRAEQAPETGPRPAVDRTAAAAPADRTRAERPVRRATPARAQPRPVPVAGGVPTGRYRMPTTHEEPSEERTESFDRPAQFARGRERAPRQERAAQQDRTRVQRRYEAAPPHPGRQQPGPAQPGPAHTGPRPVAPADGRGYGSAPEAPAHPVPQVRYRDRGDAPQDPPARYR